MKKLTTFKKLRKKPLRVGPKMTNLQAQRAQKLMKPINHSAPYCIIDWNVTYHKAVKIDRDLMQSPDEKSNNFQKIAKKPLRVGPKMTNFQASQRAQKLMKPINHSASIIAKLIECNISQNSQD